MIRLLLWFWLVCIVGCTQNQKTTIVLWHFWSEPAQRAVLDSLLIEFERLHPNVHVNATPLSWADGKTKLQLAFNAASPPDVVHIGMDWFAEFNQSDLFVQCKGPLVHNTNSVLWTVNVRALVEWTGSRPHAQWGLPSNDPHNILKRTLPIIWESGAPHFYTCLPISSTMDSNLVEALWRLNRYCSTAIIDNGRALDQSFLRGEITRLYTGMWILDEAQKRGVQTIRVVPTKSILNGDLLAVTKRSTKQTTAMNLVDWLTDYKQSSRFCLAISDAGFPADTAVYSDERFMQGQRKQFLETLRLSRPLPEAATLLTVEPIIEAAIQKCYFATSIDEVRLYVSKAREQLQRTGL